MGNILRCERSKAGSSPVLPPTCPFSSMVEQHPCKMKVVSSNLTKGFLFPRSSMVERSTVNRMTVGSSPAEGAIFNY